MLPTLGSQANPAPAELARLLARSVPEALLLPCAELPKARSGKLSALMENHVETAHLYHECSERHDALTAVVRTMQRHAGDGEPMPGGAVPGVGGDIEEGAEAHDAPGQDGWWSAEGEAHRRGVGLWVEDSGQLLPEGPHWRAGKTE